MSPADIRDALGFHRPLTPMQSRVVDFLYTGIKASLDPFAGMTAADREIPQREMDRLMEADLPPAERKVDVRPFERMVSDERLVALNAELDKPLPPIHVREMGEGHDPVDHPSHYTSHPSGVEAITITEHMGFNLGNAMKYLWREGGKNGVEDLRKAVWYINREIAKREREI